MAVLNAVTGVPHTIHGWRYFNDDVSAAYVCVCVCVCVAQLEDTAKGGCDLSTGSSKNQGKTHQNPSRAEIQTRTSRVSVHSPFVVYTYSDSCLQWLRLSFTNSISTIAGSYLLEAYIKVAFFCVVLTSLCFKINYPDTIQLNPVITT